MANLNFWAQKFGKNIAWKRSEMILQTWKKYKKELTFKKKINAMKGWIIKDMDEVVQDYIIEMKSIVENHEDIGVLDEIVYETEQPQNTVI